jgi:hypothetical protein
MPSTSDNEQAPWTEGLAHFTEAYSHSLTASRLAMGGLVALGALTTAYLWDTDRRNAFLGSMRGLSDPMTRWWSSSTTGSASSDGKSTPAQ